MKQSMTVIVTGGSAGIGEGIVRRFLEGGARVINIDINPPTGSREGAYHFHRADLSDPAETRAAARDIAAGFPVDCLVNNAGTPLPGDLDAVSDEDFDRGVNLHLRAPLILTQEVTKGMKARRFGRIVNISSRSILGKKARTVYSSTKAGMVGLTRTWAMELGAFGITVNAISPGPVMTELFKKNNPPEVARKLVDAVVVGRAGTPDDIARAVLFLADRESDYITGQVLHVCGGSSLSSSTW